MRTDSMNVRWLAGLMLCLAPLLSNAEPVTDLRVIIDVSGSMKQTDPDNLRRPALKLLTGLMPDGTRSGIWTFGEYVNMAVPHGRVDARWKERARREADKIHSRGLFTNIEDALSKATFNWQLPDPDVDRHLLLLTDGKVDVSKQAAPDQASRQRILDELLPRLQQAGVKIHSVGLSEGVDRELLTTLSAATGGWHEKARDSEALQRLFLRLFEKAVPRQQLPLNGNRFEVDGQIKEMTLLAFRRDGDPPLAVETPQQQRWSADDHPARVSWHSEADYDLVTVSQPREGEWILHTREDPDNRVMVITDLQLRVDPLPDALLAYAPLSVNAWLNDGEQVIGRGEFLELVEFSLQATAADTGKTDRYALQDGQSDGHHVRRLEQTLVAGEYTLRVRASSPTFEREQTHHLQVYAEPMQVVLEEQASGGYQLRVTPVMALFRPDTIALSASTVAGETIPLSAGPENQWQAVLPPALQGQVVSITLRAKRQDGRDFVSRLDRPLGAVEAESGAEPTAGAESTEQESEQKPPEPVETDWKWVMIIVAITNLLLILGGVGIYLYLRKLRREVAIDEDKELTGE